MARRQIDDSDIVPHAAGLGPEFDLREVSLQVPHIQMRAASQTGFCLLRGEPLSIAIRRIVKEQIDKAIGYLTSRTDDPDEAIHNARICFKKIRAILRLIRPDLGSEVFRTENLCYRDAARRLSSVRDTAAMVETLEQLGRRFPEELSAGAVAELSGPFIQAERKTWAEKQEAMEEVASTIVVLRARVDQWPICQEFSAIKRGLRSTYRHGRAAYERARRSPTTTSLHEWRKQVKYLWYQMSILNDISPTAPNLTRKTKRLADYLSEAHDLAILTRTLRKRRKACRGDRCGTKGGLAVAERRRREVREKSLVLGSCIYARKPGTWLRARAFADCALEAPAHVLPLPFPNKEEQGGYRISS